MEYRRTASLRRQLDRVGIGYEVGIRWEGGHVTNTENATRVGRVEFWEEDGELCAYGLPMTTTQAVRSTLGLVHDQEGGGMITYEPPEQQEVNAGDRVEGIGTVMDPDNFEVPSPVGCWCGDPATDELLDTGYPYSLRPELHKALKARGIDYWLAQGITFWNRDDGCECLAYGYKANGVPKLTVKVVGFTTPEQAIDATLGAGTCKQEEYGWSTEGDHARVWLTCGHDCMVETVADLPNFCPTCGRKVVNR